MANWQAVARRKAQKYGIDPGLFLAQMTQEAHGQDLTSGSNAQGPAQFIPSTAASVGLTPVTVHQLKPAYDAAAKLMASYVKKYGNYKNALIAYNAGPGAIGHSLPSETQNYLKIIMGNHPNSSATGGGGGGTGAGISSLAATSGITTGAGDRFSQLADVLKNLEAATPNVQIPYTGGRFNQMLTEGMSNMGLSPTPTPSAQMFQYTNPYKLPTLSQTVSRLASMFGGGSSTSPSLPDFNQGGGDGTNPLGSGDGHVEITGPNPGRIKKPVLNFMRAISGVAGEKIVGSDGTGHSKYTTNGNISEHWSGMASDIPAVGRHLVTLGQDALIAAGWSPSRARKERGGLYNVYAKDGTRYQIIFNINDPARGGDHTDHLHVGVSHHTGSSAGR